MIQVEMPYKPRGDQVSLYSKASRFVVGVIGRQYGKSLICRLRLAIRALKEKGVYWWVSPIVQQARVQFKRFTSEYGPIIAEVNRSFMEVRLINGSIIEFKGSDNYETLRGETLDGCVLDECGIMRSNIWSEIIRPMLVIKNGWCDFIGTPKGKNWFYKLYSGNNDNEWSTHHARSVDSPYFSESEYKKLQESTAERVFRQEYMAEFLDSDSEVFRNILGCVKGELEDPQTGRLYIMGVDLAKSYDWTVLTVWDVERCHLVAFDRFNKIDWPFQEKRIASLSNKYNNARIIVDATGVGDPVYDALVRLDLWVDPVRFTHSVKVHIIENLSMMIEKEQLTYPHLPEVIAELQIFSSDVSKAGNVKYSAPDGYHDDIVISMGLAALKLNGQSITTGRLPWG